MIISKILQPEMRGKGSYLFQELKLHQYKYRQRREEEITVQEKTRINLSNFLYHID